MKIYNEWDRVGSVFPPIEYAMVFQHGSFSLRTMLEDPWLHKMAIPTPMVHCLEESQGPSPLHGHGPWFVYEVALMLLEHWSFVLLQDGATACLIGGQWEPDKSHQMANTNCVWMALSTKMSQLWFVTNDEIFHIRIDYLHGFLNMCECIEMIELYFKNPQRVFSRTN